jgi:hypothetical protein
LRRQRECDHEVVDRQQLGTLPIEPSRRLLILTLRTTSMAARQRVVTMPVAIVAFPSDLSGLCRPATQHSVHGAPVSWQQPVAALALFKLGPVLMNDRCQLHVHTLRRSTWSLPTSSLIARALFCSVA